MSWSEEYTRPGFDSPTKEENEHDGFFDGGHSAGRVRSDLVTGRMVSAPTQRAGLKGRRELS